jgi:hypothetical protein
MARGIAARYTSLRLNLIFVSLGPPPAEPLPLYSPASARAIVGRRGSTLDLRIRKEELCDCKTRPTISCQSDAVKGTTRQMKEWETHEEKTVA